MRKFSILLSVFVLATMILAACGGEETSTTVPSTNVVPTMAATETSVAETATGTEVSTATEVPAEGSATSTAGIPVTGGAGADRLSKEIDYKVLDQSGKQVGKVEDMVLDMSKAKVLYVVVGTGGFLDIGEKKIAVPWNLMKVGQDSTNSNADKPQNAFVLQTDTDTFKNAPELDPKNVPALGQEPDSWDISMRKYWSGGGASTTNTTSSPAGTATSNSNNTGTGAGNATSTPAANAGTNHASGMGQGATTITGVQLASQVIGAKVMVGVPEAATGASTLEAAATSAAVDTSTPGTGVGAATSTPGTVGATSTQGPGATPTSSTPSAIARNVNARIDDLIVNNDAGEIMYIVVKANVKDGDHLILVPLTLFKLDSENEAFVLNIDAAILETAPSFKENEFPDMTTAGWNDEFDAFWQNNGSGGSGNSAQPTATP